MIYDALGNEVYSGDVIKNRGSAVHWPLTNRVGRQVAVCSYLVVVKLVVPEGKVIVLQKVIGVKEQ